MSLSSTFALQKAIYAELTGDAELTAFPGGAFIYDHVPQSRTPPFVVISQISTRDWPPGGSEHIATLTVWSDNPGHKQAMEISEVIRTLLHDAALTLEDHQLINLRYQSSEARRDKQSKLYQMQTRFRAVTEPQ